MIALSDASELTQQAVELAEYLGTILVKPATVCGDWLPGPRNRWSPPLPVPYSGGREWVFRRLGQLVLVDIDGKHSLAGIIAQFPEDIGEIERVFRTFGSEVVVWIDASLVSSLTTSSVADCVQSLYLHRAGEVSGLDCLQAFQQLRHLGGLGQARYTTSFSWLTALPGLVSLDMAGHPWVRDLSMLGHLERLANLDLSGCQRLQSLGGVAGLVRLESLNVSVCTGLPRDSDRILAGLPRLSKLHFPWMPRELPRQLHSVALDSDSGMGGLDWIGRLPELESVDLTAISSAHDLLTPV